MGCPAADKGANQPNLFYDPKSSESALPHFSDGSRDDLIQRRAIEAFHAHWSAEANNPASAEYDGRMVPADAIGLWSWDARPYPAFPALEDAWGDAENWRLGHWLNGRVGMALLPDVAADVCARAAAEADTSQLSGIVTGYRFDGPVSARSVLEPLAAVYGIDATEHDGKIVFRMRGVDRVGIDAGRLVEEDAPALVLTRGGLEATDTGVRLRFIDAEAEHAPGVVTTLADEQVTVEAALALDRAQAQHAADALAEQMAAQRERAQFAMAADGVMLEPGDVAVLGDAAWRIVEVAEGSVIRFEAVRASAARTPVVAPAVPVAPLVAAAAVEPVAVVVEAPPLPGAEDDLRPIGFAFAAPWTGPVTFSAGAEATEFTARGRITRPCAMGRLETALYPFASGRWQETSVWVSLPGAGLSSRSDSAVLNGANAALVETEAGWELIQFASAELVDVETWKLTRLLRGQQGSEPANAAGADIGARILFLTGAERRLDVADWERGLKLEWRAGRGSPDEAAAWRSDATHLALAGRMWSPAHLRAGRQGADLKVEWIRRARKGGDSWSAGEPPHETAERYRVRVSAGGGVLREWDVAEPLCLYAAGDQAVDFPSGGAALIEVAQLGTNGEPGGWAIVEVEISA